MIVLRVRIVLKNVHSTGANAICKRKHGCLMLQRKRRIKHPYFLSYDYKMLRWLIEQKLILLGYGKLDREVILMKIKDEIYKRLKIGIDAYIQGVGYFSEEEY